MATFQCITGQLLLSTIAAINHSTQELPNMTRSHFPLHPQAAHLTAIPDLTPNQSDKLWSDTVGWALYSAVSSQ